MPYDGSLWDENNPTNSTLANEIDDIARDIKIGTRSRMQNEHIWPAAETGTGEAGWHTTVSLQTRTATPSVPILNSTTQAGVIFSSSAFPGYILYACKDGITRTLGYPTGIVLPFAGTSTAPGTYFCDGSARSRTTDSNLFNVIGTIWGTGDGSTTFNLPNPGGFAIVAASTGGIFNTLAGTTGALTVTLDITQIPAHTHTVPTNTSAASFGSTAIANSNQAADTNRTSSSTGGGGSHPNIQPSMVFNFVIGR